MPTSTTSTSAEETPIQPTNRWSQLPKSRRGRALSPLLKSQAIALFAAGTPKIQIARRLDIAPGTVASWLNSSEIASFIPEAQERLKAMIPISTTVVHKHLRGNSLKAATFVLRGTGVVESGGLQVNINMLSAMPSDLAGRYQLPSAQAGSGDKAIEGEVVNVGGPTEAEK